MVSIRFRVKLKNVIWVKLVKNVRVIELTLLKMRLQGT